MLHIVHGWVDVFMEHNTVCISLHSDLANIHTWQMCTRARSFSPSGYLVRKISKYYRLKDVIWGTGSKYIALALNHIWKVWEFSRLHFPYLIDCAKKFLMISNYFWELYTNNGQQVSGDIITQNPKWTLTWFISKHCTFILSVRWWQHHRRVGFPCSRFVASRTGAFLHEKAKEAAEILLLLS